MNFLFLLELLVSIFYTVEIVVSSTHEYIITVYTGDVDYAETNSDVLITLFGEDQNSTEQNLENHVDTFERNKIDEFTLHFPSLGQLQGLRIRHDNTGSGPGWFLNKIIVLDKTNGISYLFPCYRWLAIDEDDGKISRVLHVGLKTTSVAPGGGCYYKQYDIGDPTVTESDVAWAKNDSLVMCAMMCFKDFNKCKSFYYTQDTGLCTGLKHHDSAKNKRKDANHYKLVQCSN